MQHHAAARTRIFIFPKHNNDINQVPTHCITQGIGTVLKARHLVLLAFGAGKAASQCRPSSSIHHGRGDETGSRHQLGRQQNVPSHPTLMLQPIDQGGECPARQLPLIDCI